MTRYIFALFIVASVIFPNAKTTTEDSEESWESSAMDGGDVSLDPKQLQSPKILDYAQQAVKKVNNDLDKEDGEEYRKLVKIVSGSSRVVNGFEYTIRFLLGKTNCEAKEVENLGSDEHCQLNEEAPELYVATIYDAPWEKDDGEVTVRLVGTQ